MKQFVRLFGVVLLSIAAFGAARTQTQTQQTPTDPKLTYEEEIAAWHQQRITSLKRPHNWLSLIALDWLDEGENLVAGFGVVTLNKGTVSFRSLPDVQEIGRAHV
jgi:hypothetical protein